MKSFNSLSKPPKVNLDRYAYKKRKRNMKSKPLPKPKDNTVFCRILPKLVADNFDAFTSLPKKEKTNNIIARYNYYRLLMENFTC